MRGGSRWGRFALQMEASAKTRDGGGSDQTLVGFNYPRRSHFGLRRALLAFSQLRLHFPGQGPPTHTRAQSLSRLGVLSALCTDCAKWSECRRGLI